MEPELAESYGARLGRQQPGCVCARVRLGLGLGLGSGLGLGLG